ncbi:MAG: DUF4386 domain-containing protein [Saprospiraceae bacterium]|nr:DUF4386 domain-containing protein [Saprospiraceae bacterium]HMW40010.1 DUF4386 domain-containing protein [Saprospiraceae bacterium]HMX89579.1 DUF4386 domain-containing protein [Saprospiraceae bacterium]HMZ41355.1 DUF4386 domain-containing protein [Saprospiraceae bacterium]HNA65679.1 DUF4386 domain-containing protein [Saprospiraceae bacterium]
MTSQRTSALITGYSLLLMAVIAGFALGYAYPTFNPMNQSDMAIQRVSEHRLLYVLMLVAMIMIAILDVIVSWTLFQYFKDANRPLSFIASLLRVVYTILFGWAILFLFKNLSQETDYASMCQHFSSFETIWSTGLMVFGAHLFAVAMLMRQHQRIPNWIWNLTLIAGVSYFAIHLIKLTMPDSEKLIDYLNKIFGLPMTLGEICLALWLVVKGGRPDAKSVS